jgi:hypothetical protein
MTMSKKEPSIFDPEFYPEDSIGNVLCKKFDEAERKDYIKELVEANGPRYLLNDFMDTLRGF